MRKKDLFIFAGEPSGDLHGEALLKNLYQLDPTLKVFGVAGPKMRQIGLDTILPMEEFQVMGFVAVFFALPKIVRHLFFLVKEILKENPETVVCIDYPGFCLRLERSLRKKGFKGRIIHYISPTIWAHGKKRKALLEKNVDLLLSILPFEKNHFNSNFPVEYVGHPLIERIAEYTYKPFLSNQNQKIISLFPGSRKKEIELNFPLQIKVLKKLLYRDSNFVGAISISQPTFIPLLKTILEQEQISLERILFIPIENAYELMAHTFLAIAKSGTITLELALHKVPTVVVYKISPCDLFIAKNILRINLPFYCIVNIIAQKEIFKELIGPFATENNLYKEALNLINDPSYYSMKKKLCEEVETLLGTSKASIKAANLILESKKQ